MAADSAGMPPVDHSSGETVAKSMRAAAFHHDPGMLDPAGCYLRESRRIPKRMKRGQGGHEDLRKRNLRPAMAQVVQECFSNAVGQRQQASFAAFQWPEQDAIITPVDVLDPQGTHLTASCAVGVKQLKNGIVSLAYRGTPINALNYHLRLLITETPWRITQPIASHRGHRSAQILRHVAGKMTELQESAQGGHDRSTYGLAALRGACHCILANLFERYRCQPVKRSLLSQELQKR